MLDRVPGNIISSVNYDDCIVMTIILVLLFLLMILSSLVYSQFKGSVPGSGYSGVCQLYFLALQQHRVVPETYGERWQLHNG